MIENASRQVLLVAAVAIASVLLIAFKDANLGLDLQGGTQLIYQLDIDAAKASGAVPKTANNNDIMQETLSIIGERIDPQGVLGATIAQRGENEFMIELPLVDKTKAQIIKGQIQNLGHLEIRMVANPDYDEDGVSFKNLADEKSRLVDWLDEGDNRARVAKNPRVVQEFNVLTTEQGGPINRWLQWYPHTIYPDYRDPTHWDYAASRRPGSYEVSVFTDAQYNNGPPKSWDPRNKPFLVEVFPINMKEEYFTGEDMDAGGVHATNDPQSGSPAVAYQLKDTKAPAYADFSARHLQEPCAIILNRIVRSAPVFQARIFGNGIITGGFTEQEAVDLAKVIKTGSLKVKPRLISDVSIGSTLGQHSIELGIVSIAIGGLLVLIFILAYYRLAGLVAFSAIALNVLLILGILRFIQATLTLPGIAGLVLTMGMAIDANILIYERIREELRRGKALLQAVRAGFDRAMITIIDANLTTFIAGVVLYNLGVGPVRGFAVTLMIGILTSLFTAFFVSRLVFHYLLETKTLKQFSTASWFSDRDYDFVKAGRLAFTASMVAVVLSLVAFFVTPSDTELGLDFTGGASLEVHFQHPTDANVVRGLLAKDKTFKAEFPSPLVNTIEADPTTGKSWKFLIKLKLTDAFSARIEREKEEAQKQGEEYEPPYKRQLRQILKDYLVADAFSDIQVVEAPDRPIDFADTVVHFTDPVAVDTVNKAVVNRFGSEGEATALDKSAGDNARDIAITFPVQRGTAKQDVAEMIMSTLEGLHDASGDSIKMSEPIPNAEDIGPQMVGQLRNAAIGALVLALFLIVMYIRLRFHEYKYSFAAVAALIHDVIVVLGAVVVFNAFGLVNAEIDLAMIAAFLTIIGYSINDTIVIFDRIRENLSDQERLGDTKESFPALLNRSINQTLSRTILTSGTTLFVVLAQFVVNRGSGSSLEGFSFALIVGIITGTYSTIFIASPLVLWLRNREKHGPPAAGDRVAKVEGAGVAVPSV